MKSPNFFNIGSLFIIFKTLEDNSVYAKPNMSGPDVAHANLQPLTYKATTHP